jgi:hypothetical protein
MKKFLLLLAVMLPLVGCPKKNKQDTTPQSDPKAPDSEPASNRATPATPSR